MKLIANIAAILVMGAFAYAVLSVLPMTSELAPIWVIVVTAALGAVGLHSWQPSESINLSSPREWIALFLGWWFLSVIFFLIACWLRNVPLREALTLPPSLWKDVGNYYYDRPFWWAMAAGPGYTLLGIGTLVRLAVLRLSGAPLNADCENHSDTIFRLTEKPKSSSFLPHESLWIPGISYLIFFASLFLVWGIAAWSTIEVLRGQTLLGSALIVIWLPLFIALARLLHRHGMIRMSVSVVTTAILILTVGFAYITLKS